MRRIIDALVTILATVTNIIVTVITLPFRVLSRLLAPSRRRAAVPRRRRGV
ncbi:MAG TPA: hypothetical protein VE465_08600 [Streptosporangiaceae bacterium]|jgi:hypothetical protein|nr:hypothetical protein [Streptosporangiaceae bacterium]